MLYLYPTFGPVLPQRNEGHLKAMFKRILLETVYPLVGCSQLPAAVWGDENQEQVSFMVLLINRLSFSVFLFFVIYPFIM